MPSHRTRAQERADEIDISPTKLLADIEALKGRGRGLPRPGRRVPRRPPARARRVPQLQAPHGRGAPARPRPRGRGPHPQGPGPRRRLRPGHRGATGFDRHGPLVRGRQRHRSQAPPAPRERGRDARSTPRRAPRSIRASTRPSPTCPAPAARRARSSSRSGGAIDCATASCGRPSWPSPRAPARRTHHRPPSTTDPFPEPQPERGAHTNHGQDHRHRPRHDELRRRRHGGRRADRHRVGGGRSDHPERRRLHQDRRAAGRPAGQAPGRHQPRQHRLLHQALHGPSLGRPGGQAQQGARPVHRREGPELGRHRRQARGRQELHAARDQRDDPAEAPAPTPRPISARR